MTVRERIAWAVAEALPRDVVACAFALVFGEATTGRYAKRNALTVTCAEALDAYLERDEP